MLNFRNILWAFFFLISHVTMASRVSYFTLAVKDIESVASQLSKAGFTLKVPHAYKSGHQKGLISQSVKLRSGQYFQILALNPQVAQLGALANWYRRLINNTNALPLGATLAIEQTQLPLKGVHQLFKDSKIQSQLSKYPQYSWLSFPTKSPYAPLSFINQKFLPDDSDELLQHKNKATALGHIEVRPYGDPSTWAKIMKLSGALEAKLLFKASLFKGKGFISSAEIITPIKPLPKPLQLGHLTLKFIH